MNTLSLYINFPSWIHPEIFPGVQFLSFVRWYGLMYAVAFSLAYLILRKQLKEGLLDSPKQKATTDDIYSFIFTGIIFLILGARIFSTLVYNVYDPTNPNSINYWAKPWLIFWPFDLQTHKYVGLAGMSYHGGFIGGLIGMIIWCSVKKRPLWKWIDAMCVGIPLGYTFGRLGNFMNGELYGRITTMPWGMIFPSARSAGDVFSASLPWVQEFAAECGMEIAPGSIFVNLPRHPSQLYEAFFEGLALFLLLFSFRKRKPFDGFIGALYTIGYGTVRFILEYFRQPDLEIGYKIVHDGNTSVATNTSLLNISTGQILCFLMIVGGIILMIVLGILDKKRKKQSK